MITDKFLEHINKGLPFTQKQGRDPGARYVEFNQFQVYKAYLFRICKISLPYWRNHEIGHLKDLSEYYCGYVYLSPLHPLFGKDSDRLDISCHGGITLSSKALAPVDQFWELGFDCAHAWDNIKNCNEAYVIAECKSIIDQLCEKNYA